MEIGLSLFYSKSAVFVDQVFISTNVCICAWSHKSFQITGKTAHDFIIKCMGCKNVPIMPRSFGDYGFD